MSYAEVFQADKLSTAESLSSDPLIQQALVPVLAKLRSVTTRISTVSLSTTFTAGDNTYKIVYNTRT